MRLLHTSDWHLGRTLHGLDIIDAQRAALDHIAATARDHQVDAVLICGDVYDRAVPPVDAVRLFHQVLRELVRICPVIVTSGNHDSAIRLGFGADLFTQRLHIRTEVERIAEPIELADEHGPVLVYALPYLDPDLARGKLGEDVPRSHEGVVGAAMQRVREDLQRRGNPRSVVMAHAFVARAEESASRSDSERDIRVGGVELVPASLFNGITYTALGHLHGPQEAAVEDGCVRYSGSPLRYSFSEAGHTKSVTLVDLGADGVSGVRTVEVPQPRPMLQVTGRLAEVLARADAEAWVKAVVTDPVRPEGLFERLQKAFPHLLSAHHVPEGAATVVGVGADLVAQDPLEAVAAFFAEAGGEEMSDAERQLIRDVYEELIRQEAANR